MFLVFSYFNQKLGPQILISLPEELSEELDQKIIGFFDLKMSENLFEIILIEEQLKITNLFIEIPSEWGRGSRELAMISVITEKDFKYLKNNEFIRDAIKKTAEKITSTENVYKSVYKDGSYRHDKKEIEEKYQDLKNILKECLNLLIKEFKSEIDPTKIVKKFRRLTW